MGQRRAEAGTGNQMERRSRESMECHVWREKESGIARITAEIIVRDLRLPIVYSNFFATVMPDFEFQTLFVQYYFKYTWFVEPQPWHSYWTVTKMYQFIVTILAGLPRVTAPGQRESTSVKRWLRWRRWRSFGWRGPGGGRQGTGWTACAIFTGETRRGVRISECTENAQSWTLGSQNLVEELVRAPCHRLCEKLKELVKNWVDCECRQGEVCAIKPHSL